MPTDVRRKSTRSAMIIAFPESARAPCGSGAIWRSMAFTPSWSFPTSTLAPPGERVASDRVGRVHGLRRVVHVGGSSDGGAVDDGALVDEPAHDVRDVGRSAAGDGHVSEAH